ncbi:MAG: OPT family oligopeptide transporter [Kofleriaceae bacterium]
MSETSSNDLPGVIPKPPGTREFTPRAVIAGIVVAAIMGASYPYVVLKLGFGPNVSVVAAFFGYLFLGILFRNFNRWENNIVQTAGTSAAQTAFMCVILAAFDFVAQNPKLHYTFAPTPFQAFLWLTAASILGILLAVPLRRHYVVDEQLTYADGVAAAETIIVLDSRGPAARQGALALGLGLLASAAVWFFTQKWGGRLFDVPAELSPVDLVSRLLAHSPIKYDPTGVIPEVVLPTMFGLTAATTSAGFQVSLLSIGSGMIVGNRINISMAIGGLISWVIAPKFLFPAIIAHESRKEILLWVMWPGTGMLIAAGLTALLLKWRTLARTFSTLSADSIEGGDFPLKWVSIGSIAATIALVAIQRGFFGVPLWLSVVSAALSAPLMLVGLRVLGETNWGPISQLTNVMQALFAGLSPGNLTTNLVASGTTGTVAVQSEAIMQDYKTGHIIGSTPRFLTYSQLIAAPIGAAAVAFTYPLYKSTYGIGGDTGLSSPISVRIAGFADVLSSGFDALPKYSLMFLVIGAVVGILITFGEIKWKKYLPSPTGLGIGMMVPGNVVFTMVMGGVFYSIWLKLHRSSADKIGMPLASGLIAGEAIMAIIIPVLIATKLLAN